MARYSRYSDVRIKCPYYKYTVKTQIFCEADHSIIFRGEETITAWKEKHCEMLSSSCPIKKLIEEGEKNGW